MKHHFSALRWILAVVLATTTAAVLPPSAGAAGTADGQAAVTLAPTSTNESPVKGGDGWTYISGSPATHGTPPRLGKPPTPGKPPTAATKPGWHRASDKAAASATTDGTSQTQAQNGPTTASTTGTLTGTVNLATAAATQCQITVFTASSDGSYGESGYGDCTDGTFSVGIFGDTSPIQAKALLWLSGDNGDAWTEWVGSSDNTETTAGIYVVPDGGSQSTGALSPHAPERVSGKIGNLASIGATECGVEVYVLNSSGYADWSTSGVCEADGTLHAAINWSPTPLNAKVVLWAGDGSAFWSEWVGSTDNTDATAQTFLVPSSGSASIGTIVMHAPERLTGKIGNLAAVGASGCDVVGHSYDAAGDPIGWYWASCSADGGYTITFDWLPTPFSVKLEASLTDDLGQWQEWLGSSDNTEATASVFNLAPSANASAGTANVHSPQRFTGTVSNLAAVDATGCGILLWRGTTRDGDQFDSLGQCATDGAFVLTRGWDPTPPEYRVQVEVQRITDSQWNSWHEWAGSSNNTWATAKTFTPDPGGTTNIGTITVHQASSISGTVTRPAGTDSDPFVPVTFYDVDGQVVLDYQNTNEAGQYSALIGFGTYTVGFARQSGPYPYAGQFYSGVSEDQGLGTATAVALAPGATKSGVSGTLVAGATITGKVLNADGTPAQQVEVLAFADDGIHTTRGWANTDANGSYAIKGLSSGSYTVFAQRWAGSGPEERWSGNEGAKQYAQQVAVTSGQSTRLGDLTFDPPSFADVPDGRVFYGEISWLAVRGISTGWEESDGTHTYRPLTPVARDAMAAFLYRLAGKPTFTPPGTSPFPDVPLNHPFYKEITWLASTGISTGWPQPDGTKLFKPADPVARDAMAAFLYRFAGKPAFTPPGTSPFPDVPLDYPFYKEITWLASTGISTGWPQPNGTKLFKPADPVARDAMAAFMYRYNTKQLPTP